LGNGNGERHLVLINGGAEPRDWRLPGKETASGWRLLVDSAEGRIWPPDPPLEPGARLTLPERAVLVLEGGTASRPPPASARPGAPSRSAAGGRTSGCGRRRSRSCCSIPQPATCRWCGRRTAGSR